MWAITFTYFPLVKTDHVSYPKEGNLDFDKQNAQYFLESLSSSIFPHLLNGNDNNR